MSYVVANPRIIDPSDSSPEENLQKAMAYLRHQSPAVAAFVRESEVIITEDVPTAAYNLKGEFLVSKTMLTRKSAEYVAFAISHVALLREAKAGERLGDRDSHAWNMAISHEIYGRQQELGIPFPENLFHDPKFYGQKAEDIYEEMVKKVAAWEAEDAPSASHKL